MNWSNLLNDFKTEYRKIIETLLKEYTQTELDNLLLTLLEESYSEIYTILKSQIKEPLNTISRDLIEKYTKLLTLANIYIRESKIELGDRIRNIVMEAIYNIRKAAGTRENYIFTIRDLS